jgi:hypothetical protein
MQVPDYGILMNKHNIKSVIGGSDIALDPQSMSIQSNRRGDIRWQGKAHNAMFQFINEYITNWPKLHQLFSEITASYVQEKESTTAQNAHAEDYAKKVLNNEPVDNEKMYALSSEKSGIINGRQIAAGTIFVVLNTMFQELKKDLEIDGDKFGKSGPLFQQQTFGKVVWAASNNFRHAEEWRAQWVADKSFKDQQLQSVTVLAPVLGFEQKDYRFLSCNVCPETLAVLSNGNFEILEQHLFSFANALADGVENIKTHGIVRAGVT